jgi:hypothetical protein
LQPLNITQHYSSIPQAFRGHRLHVAP